MEKDVYENAVNNFFNISKSQCLLVMFTKKLRIVFRERYEFEHGHPYDKNKNDLIVVNFYKNFYNQMQIPDIIYPYSPSNIDCWNIGTLILYLINIVPKKIENIEKFKKENQIIKKLKNLLELSTLTEPDFNLLVHNIKLIFKKFSELNGEVIDDKQLTLLLDSDQDKVNSKLKAGYIINEELENQCLKLKEIGNEYFKNFQFSKAIEFYTKAIKLIQLNKNEVSNKTMAILLLNLATSQFELYKINNNFKNQKLINDSKITRQISSEFTSDDYSEYINNAKTASQFYPCWGKIYYKLSQFCYQSPNFETEIYEGAINSKCAVKLEPKNSVFENHANKVEKDLYSKGKI